MVSHSSRCSNHHNTENKLQMNLKWGARHYKQIVLLCSIVFDHDRVEPGEVAIGDCQKSHEQAVDKVGVEQDRGEEPLTGSCDD